MFSGSIRKAVIGLSTVFAVGLTSATASDTQIVVPSGSASAQYAAGPAMWKLADHDTTIYLFGTIHILSKDVEWRTESFDSIWENADVIYFETDTSPQAQAGTQKLVFSLGFNHEGTGFSSFFNDEELALISEEAGKIGLSIASFEPFRPWLAGLTISVMQLVAAGGDPKAGVEMILGGEAREAGKVMRFFETNEQQVGFFADLPDESAAKMLIDGLRQYRAKPDFFTELVEVWRNGKVEELGRLLNDAMSESDPAIAETILYKRNAGWAETLATVMNNEKGVFLVAVGAGHLAGEKSLQAYLAEKGIATARY